MKPENIQFLIVDLFCGFGGTTTGFHDAEVNGETIAKVIACINHDPKAIKSHHLNYPHVKHFSEDIRTLDLTELIAHTAQWRIIYPNAKLILWASLECTNFSKAKGGMARDADSRTLAEHLFRYQHALQPEYIQIENVVEFMSWGPLDENGKPVSRKNGSDWLKWRNQMNSFGYYDQWQEMNSANFGAYTSRNRLFGCFARPDLPIVWPLPTHSKKASSGMFTNLKQWKPVKDMLDFTDEGESIFNRKKDLSDKTLERIYAGLIKFVANGDKSFISKYYSGKPEGKVISVDGPAGTIRCVDGQGLIQIKFLLQTYAANSKGHNTFSVEGPARVLTTRDSTQVVALEFLSAYYGNGDNCSSVEGPCPVIPTKDRFQFVQLKYFIYRDFTNGGSAMSIDKPAGSIPTVPKINLIEVTPFIVPTNFNNNSIDINGPMQVITANRKHHYLVNPQYGNKGNSTDEPCPVIIASQNKRPLLLVAAETGQVLIPVYESDSDITIKIKEFMAIYGLADIKMRMLRVAELLKIQGFPPYYHMVGNQSDAKKFIGNSVVPVVVQRWVEALSVSINQNKKAA